MILHTEKPYCWNKRFKRTLYCLRMLNSSTSRNFSLPAACIILSIVILFCHCIPCLHYNRLVFSCHEVTNSDFLDGCYRLLSSPGLLLFSPAWSVAPYRENDLAWPYIAGGEFSFQTVHDDKQGPPVASQFCASANNRILRFFRDAWLMRFNIYHMHNFNRNRFFWATYKVRLFYRLYGAVRVLIDVSL